MSMLIWLHNAHAGVNIWCRDLLMALLDIVVELNLLYSKLEQQLVKSDRKNLISE